MKLLVSLFATFFAFSVYADHAPNHPAEAKKEAPAKAEAKKEAPAKAEAKKEEKKADAKPAK